MRLDIFNYKMVLKNQQYNVFRRFIPNEEKFLKIINSLPYEFICCRGYLFDQLMIDYFAYLLGMNRVIHDFMMSFYSQVNRSSFQE